MTAVKTTLRDLSIALCAAGGLSTLYRARARREGPLLRVLVFHDVQDPKGFLDTLVFIKRHYHVVTPEECFGNKLDASRINVLITFDDGYASWTDVCLPILSSLNIKGLFFVCSGLLDAHDDEAARARYVKERLFVPSPPATLSWEGLRALHHAGHTVGGHTATHPRLSGLQRHEQRAEIADDKERIETVLQTPITAFAYPFGEFTSHAEQVVHELGYAHAFSTEERFATPARRARIPRLCVEDAMSSVALRRWVEGGHDVYTGIKGAIKKMLRIGAHIRRQPAVSANG